MRNKIFVLSLFMLMILSSSAPAEIYSEGEALAVFRVPKDVSVSAAGVSVADAVAEMGATVTETYETLSEIEGKVFVLVRSSAKSTEQLIAELKARPDVITASPNYYVQHLSEIEIEDAALYPNDPSADLCWGLEAIRAPEVWDRTTGSRNIYAAVVDTGVYKHPDLMDNIASEYGYNTQTVSGEYDVKFVSWDADFQGHGTHVSGTIGAVGDNGIGVAGVNWNVSIIPVRVFDTANAFETINFEIRALNYVASLLRNNNDMKLAALNFSLSAYLPIKPSEMQNDVYYMAYQALDSLNRTLIVVSAGNSGLESGVPAPFDEKAGDNFKKGTYQYPASFTGLNNLIVVGAMVSDDTAAFFSNWGNSVDIAAPGFDILSTYSPVAIGETPKLYTTLNGTSMAAPHVTGAAALLMSVYPDATPSQIKTALLEGANRDKNPIVYPYAGFTARLIRRRTQQLDSDIASGIIPAASRDVMIERITRETEELYAPYKQLDGTGRVSRTGLLDVKAAYDILSVRGTGSRRSSSSGCSAGSSTVIFSAVIVSVFAMLKRKKFSA